MSECHFISRSYDHIRHVRTPEIYFPQALAITISDTATCAYKDVCDTLYVCIYLGYLLMGTGPLSIFAVFNCILEPSRSISSYVRISENVERILCPNIITPVLSIPQSNIQFGVLIL